MLLWTKTMVRYTEFGQSKSDFEHKKMQKNNRTQSI